MYAVSCNRGGQCCKCRSKTWPLGECLQYVKDAVYLPVQKCGLMRVWVKRASVSHLFSAALCFVVSAGRVSPGSEIWHVLAHCDSPALSPAKKNKEKESHHINSQLTISPGFCQLNALKTIVPRSSIWDQLMMILLQVRSNAPAMMSNQLEKQRSVLLSIVYVWEREGCLACHKTQHIAPLSSSVLCYIYPLQPDFWLFEQLLLLQDYLQKIQLFLQHSGHDLHDRVTAGGRSLRKGSSILAYGEETG